MSDPDENGGSWTLLTGHGHVLVEIARNPSARIRDISAVVGLTERTVQAIVANLEDAGLPHPHPHRAARPVHREPRQPVPALRPGRTPSRPVPDPARRSRDRHHHTRARRRMRPGTGSRHAGGSVGALPRTRRRNICDSRNLSRPYVTAGQPHRDRCAAHVHAKTALTQPVRHQVQQPGTGSSDPGRGRSAGRSPRRRRA
jgi:winged helix-turn-helix DNA-binding protein